MGRKSNRKKGRLELRAAIEAEQRRQQWIEFLILIPGCVLFIWGLLLFDRTFINQDVTILITISGGAIGIIGLHFLWRYRNHGLMATLFLGFFLGGPIPYCFMATTNYYFRDKKIERVNVRISETGNRSGRKSSCRTPYAVIVFQNIKKEIPFECEYETSIFNYKRVTLTVSKGLWGYMVYTEKSLDD